MSRKITTPEFWAWLQNYNPELAAAWDKVEREYEHNFPRDIQGAAMDRLSTLRQYSDAERARNNKE